jgi:hypothetical protein
VDLQTQHDLPDLEPLASITSVPSALPIYLALAPQKSHPDYRESSVCPLRIRGPTELFRFGAQVPKQLLFFDNPSHRR